MTMNKQKEARLQQDVETLDRVVDQLFSLNFQPLRLRHVTDDITRISNTLKKSLGEEPRWVQPEEHPKNITVSPRKKAVEKEAPRVRNSSGKKATGIKLGSQTATHELASVNWDKLTISQMQSWLTVLDQELPVKREKKAVYVEMVKKANAKVAKRKLTAKEQHHLAGLGA